MAGMALAILTYRPIFDTFLKDSNPEGWTDTKLEQFAFYENGTAHETKKNSDSTWVVSSKQDIGGGYATTTIAYIKKADKTEVQSVTFSNKHLPKSTYWKFIGLVFLLILYVTMVYGPIAAFLVEMFPTKIRYTSRSLPYHIGNGVFGGLVPFIGLLLTTTYPADPLVGLWYPIGVAALCLLIGVMYLRNKIDRNIKD
jgi:hypothetical protein